MSSREEKLIITCALTGSDTFPTQTPYLPITPDQIAEEAKRAQEAGAAIVHVHAREPDTGKPTSDLKIWRQILTKIKEKCDVIVCITTGGALGMTAKERVAVVPEFQPELCSFNIESMNFSVYSLLKRFDWKYEWERKMIESTKWQVYQNSFQDLEVFAKTMKEYNAKPECEIYGSNGLYNARYLVREGLVDLPLHMQFVLGVTGGTAAYPQELLHLQTEALRMFGTGNFTWSTVGVGYPRQFTMAAVSIAMGGHVRTGLEDNIFVRYMKHAKSNAELVKEIHYLADMFNRQVATSSEARKILNLKGIDKVNY
jgi:uncharacterized protein (DUF849 family)